MRRLLRPLLPDSALTFLQNRTADVMAQPGLSRRVERAKEQWKNKENKAFDAVKEALQKMSPGLHRCMYCEDNEGLAIDHFFPQAEYPVFAFCWQNYLWACTLCNSNHKRDQFPLDAQGEPLLIDPTREDPRMHLEFSPRTGKWIGRTDKGEASIKVFGLQRGTLVQARKNAWQSVQALVVIYGEHRKSGALARAEKQKKALCEFPHAGVLVALLRMARRSSPGKFIDARCLEALEAHPEIFDWLP